MTGALARIGALEAVLEPPRMIRIEALVGRRRAGGRRGRDERGRAEPWLRSFDCDDRNLALEAVRVTERAAIASSALDGPRRREGGRSGGGRRDAPGARTCSTSTARS